MDIGKENSLFTKLVCYCLRGLSFISSYRVPFFHWENAIFTRHCRMCCVILSLPCFFVHKLYDQHRCTRFAYYQFNLWTISLRFSVPLWFSSFLYINWFASSLKWNLRSTLEMNCYWEYTHQLAYTQKYKWQHYINSIFIIYMIFVEDILICLICALIFIYTWDIRNWQNKHESYRRVGSTVIYSLPTCPKRSICLLIAREPMFGYMLNTYS